jgi:hypothetical protein
MSSDGEKCLELVLLDGSNYESWCNSILHYIEAFNPYLLNIVDASICPQISIGLISPRRKENVWNSMLKLFVY